MKFNTRSAAFGAALLTMTSLFSQLIGFLYRVGLSRFLGGAGMGLFSLVMSVYSVLMSVVSVGLSVSVSRLSSQYAALGETRSVFQLVRRACILLLGVFVLVSIPVVPLSDAISVHILGDARTRMGLLLLLPCIFLTGIENIHKNHFYGLKRVGIPALSETVEICVRTVAVLGLLYFLRPKYEELSVGLVVCGMIVCEVASCLLLRFFYRRERQSTIEAGRGLPPRVMASQMAAFALPMAASSLTQNLLGSANAVMIPARLTASGLSPAEALSSFGVLMGMTLPLIALPTVFLGALGLVVVPRLTEDAARRDLDSMRRRVRQTVKVTTIGVLLTMTLMALFGEKLAVAVYRQPEAGAHMLLLCIGTVFGCYEGMLANLLSGMGKIKRAAGNLIAAGIIQLCLTWVLTAMPSVRLAGFGWAHLVSSIAGAALCAMDVRQGLKAESL